METNMYKRLLCYFDILGFSNMIETLSIDQILSKFNNIYKAIIQAEYREIQKQVFKKMCDLENAKECESDIQTLEECYSDQSKDQSTRKKVDSFLDYRKLIKCLIISDSIIIYTDPLDQENDIMVIFRCFIMYVRDFMIQAFMQKILLRGAVSIGSFYIDIENSIYFGPALIDAIKLEGLQQWIGCALCDSLNSLVKQYFEKFSEVRLFEEMGFVMDIYPVPLKKGVFSKRYIINWAPGLIGKVSFNSHFFDAELTGDQNIDIKYKNTLDYWKWWESRINALMKIK